jgi:hypothetical protein
MRFRIQKLGSQRAGGPWSGPALACACSLLALMSACADSVAGESSPVSDRAERTAGPLPAYRITVARSANGGILPSQPAPVPRGGDARFAIFPRTGYHLDSLLVDGAPVRLSSVLVLKAIRASHTVAARFSANEYVIVAAAGPHASITPTGIVGVTHGRSQTFLFGADSGFAVCELLVDGKAVRGVPHYTFANVRAPHRIEVRTTHHAASVIAPEPGELWLSGESREVRWQPLERERVDSAEVRVSCHGPDGPWEPVWRGLFRTGSALWEVPAMDCDSLVVCVATIDTTSAPGMDLSRGLVRVRRAQVDLDPRFFVRAVPSPAVAGPIRLEYSVPAPGEAALEIYTVSGREVWRQPLGFALSGRRNATWDGRLAGGARAEPGVYFARLSTRQGERNCRLVLLP